MSRHVELISLAFFVLFIGLGVDFAIQFNIRYRAERHERPKLLDALQSSAFKAGIPLTLAGVATAVGFSSFLPTAYRGLSELGQIAGIGMIIALVTSVTLLPALLAILNPPGEPRPMGFVALAPVDRFLDRHRRKILWGTLVVVGLASPLLLSCASILLYPTCAARNSNRSQPTLSLRAIREAERMPSSWWHLIWPLQTRWRGGFPRSRRSRER